jgi:hypothetical protein
MYAGARHNNRKNNGIGLELRQLQELAVYRIKPAGNNES